MSPDAPRKFNALVDHALVEYMRIKHLLVKKQDKVATTTKEVSKRTTSKVWMTPAFSSLTINSTLNLSKSFKAKSPCLGQDATRRIHGFRGNVL
jgi:hypothetical protein